MSTSPKILWSPKKTPSKSSLLTQFIAQNQPTYEIALSSSSYSDLYQWSVDSPEIFWKAVSDFCSISYHKSTNSILKKQEKFQNTEWFLEAELNFAENLLLYRDETTALTFYGEDQITRSISYQALYQKVISLAQSLLEAGVTTGDRVAGCLPNFPETIIAMLATTAIGAIWSSCSPDLGVSSALDRFAQITPKVLFVADQYLWKGRRIDLTQKNAQLSTQLPSVIHTITIPYFGEDSSDITTNWSQFTPPREPSHFSFPSLSFSHPAFIMFSSGTTGKPKCIIHGGGRVLLELKKEFMLHCDITRDDTVFYQTTCGWMMWNWLVSTLSVGAKIVLYDGFPLLNEGKILWSIAERERISVFGTNAKYLALMQQSAIKPNQVSSLSSIRLLLSTGSPLSPEGFDYVYQNINPSLQLASISGGTDILGCFALGCPNLPVYRGELQCRSLGIAIEVFDNQGNPIRNQKGELVCTQPFPSMPVGFWDDPEGARYESAYFQRFPGIWHHGDLVELTDRETMIFYGRSDATLNPGGVRIGTAEIYNQLTNDLFPELIECAAVAQSWEGDQRIILFVRLHDGYLLDQPLRDRMIQRIKNQTTHHHIPKKIIQVPDLPRTHNGKISELAITHAIHGRTVNYREAFLNPESLGLFSNVKELLD